ncbi:three-helix bundle dimerization domain-containing protein [Nocardia tengchongensis]|uniref:three-helix bundle dimerization domain-containing protein n=1 Tax=Nocardia tengchongensis TaxID=2055889 RepID=UPI00360D99A8
MSSDMSTSLGSNRHTGQSVSAYGSFEDLRQRGRSRSWAKWPRRPRRSGVGGRWGNGGTRTARSQRRAGSIRRTASAVPWAPPYQSTCGDAHKPHSGGVTPECLMTCPHSRVLSAGASGVWTIATIVHEVHHGFDGRPVREYVPLLVERVAARQLVSAIR